MLFRTPKSFCLLLVSTLLLMGCDNKDQCLDAGGSWVDEQCQH